MAGLSTTTGYSAEGRRSDWRLDWGLLLSSAALLIVGLLSLYSVGAGGQETFFKKQVVNVLIGLVPFGLFSLVRPNTWRKGAGWLYAFNILCLLAVFAVGKTVKGSERWILLPGGIQFQPSELAKLLTIITLSTFYANRQESIQKFGTFMLGFLHVAVPLFLIWKQPHLGAAMAVFVMWCAVSLVAGVRGSHLAAFLGALLVFGALVLSVPSLRGKLIHGYQQSRISGLQSGTKDTQGRNWQTDRAEIAFGVGGETGAGYLRGEQKQAGFIPEQHTDFIVTVIGEEGGLVGCALLLATYGLFFYRVFLIMLNATEPYYKMLGAGVFAVLGFHTFVNIAMVLQILPVVGLWLPFMSYGGTAIWLCMACVGLLLSVRRQQRPLLF
jgi:rod shape determining protein RodA